MPGMCLPNLVAGLSSSCKWLAQTLKLGKFLRGMDSYQMESSGWWGGVGLDGTKKG